jgi:acetyltransferase-like isoleucine patch superfamily enzyme
LGFVLFIFTMILIVPFCNFFIPFKNVSYKGAWFSLQSIPWYYHNALTYLVRYTILDFITPSPINILFFKLMGMKIGKNVMINTSNISDPCKITLGDNVTLGGSCYLMAHYGVNGYLVIDKLIINDRSTIGLSAKILGGVVIGKNVVVGPNVVILPKSNIEDGTKLKVS